MPETTINCPACGGENPADAVFCGNPECHKALGEFTYVVEELGPQARWHEVTLSRVAKFIGRPQFIGVHVVWIVLWVAMNTGLIVMSRFDRYPFSLLGLLLSIEAILMTSVVIIGEGSQSKLANKRAELDYEVNVRTYREILRLNETVARLEARLSEIDNAD